MEKQELVVKKDLSIENEKQFDDYLTEIKNRYGSLVVSKETEKDTKKVIAELRKLKREINSKRIEVQKEYEKPAKLFKEKIDNKLSVIEDVVSNLDSGVKQLEETRKTEKRNKINKIIESMSKEYDFDGKINFDNRWLNKSYKMLDIEKDIKSQIKTFKRDENDWALVKKYALNRGAFPEYYHMFVGAYSVFDIQRMIDDDVAHNEKEQKKFEKEQKKSKQQEVVDENGEIVKKLEKVSFTVCGTKDEIDDLSKYIAKSNLQVLGKPERTTMIGD